MEFLQSVFFFLLTLGILVSIHEFGHFVVARVSGVKVVRFAIGFGSPILRRQWSDGTEFVIGAIPLGGYVRMLDEREGTVDPKDAARTFNRLSPVWRILIALAGPAANLLLAVLAYWLVFMVGVRDLPAVFAAPVENSIAARSGMPAGALVTAVDGEAVASMGDVYRKLANRLGETGTIELTTGGQHAAAYQLRVQDWLKGSATPDLLGSLGLRMGFRIGDVLPGSAAERAGLRAGDEVLRIDGKAMPGWKEFATTVHAAPGRLLTISVRREGAELDLALTPTPTSAKTGVADSNSNSTSTPNANTTEKVRGLAGVAALTVRRTHNPIEAFPLALSRTGGDIAMTLGFIKKIVTGHVSSSNVSGPVTIAQIASESAELGYEYFVSILALLSISVAVLNLLPIPVLDGGHVLYAACELVTGRAVPERVQVIGLQIGLFFVASLTVLALYNDVVRLLLPAMN